MPNKDKSDAATDHESVSAMADRLSLKGSARTDYIGRHMKGLGHRAVTNWVDDDENDDGGFFGSRSGSRSRRSGHDDDDDGF